MKSISSVGIAVISGLLLICHFCAFVSCGVAWNDKEQSPDKVQRKNLFPFSNQIAKRSAGCDHHHTQCASTGDPHFTTFHGHRYDLLQAGIGVFTLVKLDSRDLWIQAEHVSCNGAASCNCGVMAREGNRILGITKCNRASPLLVEYQLDRWSPSGSIHQISDGRWRIILVSGVEIEVIMWEGGQFLHVYVKGLASELWQYGGLCSCSWNCEQHRVKDSQSFFSISQSNYPSCGTYWISPVCRCRGGTYPSCPSDAWDVYRLKVDVARACGYKRQTNDKDDKNAVSSNKEDIIEPEDLNEGQTDNPNPVQSAEDGRSRCIDALRLTPAYEICSGRVNTSDIIEDCAKDENLMKEDGPAKSVPTELETVCLDDIRLSIEADASSQELKDLLAKVEKLVCPSQCSQRGKCVDSKCQCNEGFMGTDCSLKIGQVPVVDSLIMPVCDIRKHPCTQIHLEATKLTNPEDVVCKMRSVDDLGDAVPAVQTSTPVISGGLVLCKLPVTPVSTKESNNGISTTVFRVQVSISNDGQTFSQELPFTVLDGHCMECPASQDTPCQLKENTCSIGGRCYKAEETCPLDATKICNPAKCSTKWTGESSTNCDDGSENCT